MTTFNLTCEAVETMLHEYLDETLEPWVRISIEEHLRECAPCTALARELRNISREAAALPALLPESDPWPRVADRIGVPLIESPPVAEVAPVTPAPEPKVSESEVPLPISERYAVAIEPPVSTAEPAMASEPPMQIGEPPMRMGEPPVLRSEEPPVLTSDGPPVIAIPVYVLPSPKEASVSQPGLVADDLPSPASEPLAPASGNSDFTIETILSAATRSLTHTATILALPASTIARTSSTVRR